MRILGHESRLFVALFAHMVNVEYDRAPTVVALSLTLRAAGTVAGSGDGHERTDANIGGESLSKQERLTRLWCLAEFVA